MADLTTSQSPAMKRWTVTMKDGTVYRGVAAQSREEAMQKMAKGPQGVLAPQSSLPASEKVRVLGGIGDIMRNAGRPEDEIAATTSRIGGKLPGSWTDVAGAAVPLAVGALIKPGRTVTRIGGQVLGNVVGRASTEMAGEALNPSENSDILTEGIKGAGKGVLPGMTQGVLGGIFGPSKTTIQTQKALNAIRESVSPTVAAALDPSKPASLLSRNTVKAMQQGASANLDTMEADLGKRLQGTQFSVMIPGSTVRSPAGLTFEDVRGRIKALRDIGEAPYQSDILRGKAREALHAAQSAEKDLVDQMRAAGKGKEAQQYLDALKQYVADKDAIRYVRGVQSQNALPGNVNPQDRPGLAEAQGALSSIGGLSPKTAIHGVLGAVEAAMGRPVGAGYQLGRAGDQLRNKGPLTPAQSSPSPLTALPGALAGAGVSAGQTALIEDYPNGP